MIRLATLLLGRLPVRFALRRLGRAIGTVLVAFVLVFVAIRATPGGPARGMLGQRASPEEVARINQQFGWDLPVYRQLVAYLGRAAPGDLGVAYFSPGQPNVTAELARRFPATVELSIAALLLATIGGLALGIAAATHRGRWPDQIGIALSSFGVSIPVFFLGILLLLVFRNMPGSGRVDVRLPPEDEIVLKGMFLFDTMRAGRWDLFWHVLAHLILPAVALASVPMSIIARVARSSLLEVLSSDFIRTARAKGCGPGRVLFRHAVPAAAVPVLSLLGMQLASLLAGAVLTETVFSWPGIGRYVLQAATQKDYNALQGAVLLLGGVFIFVNFVTDLLCAWLDPRIRLGTEAGR